MQLKTTISNSITIIVLSGRIDTTNADDLHAALIALLHDRPPHFIIDMNAVDYLSSAGMRAFLITIKEIETRHGKMLFVGFCPMVEEVVHMAGLNKYFPQFLSVEIARLEFS